MAQENILTVIFLFLDLNLPELIFQSHQMIKTVMMRTVRYHIISKNKNLNLNFLQLLKNKWKNMDNLQEEITLNLKYHLL